MNGSSQRRLDSGGERAADSGDRLDGVLNAYWLGRVQRLLTAHEDAEAALNAGLAEALQRPRRKRPGRWAAAARPRGCRGRDPRRDSAGGLRHAEETAGRRSRLPRPGELAWSPAVEIAVHTGSRYRLIGLTHEEARELAGLLAQAADIVTVTSRQHLR